MYMDFGYIKQILTVYQNVKHVIRLQHPLVLLMFMVIILLVVREIHSSHCVAFGNVSGSHTSSNGVGFGFDGGEQYSNIISCDIRAIMVLVE